MKKELTTYEAVDILLADEYAGWSRAGATALVEYLDQLQDEADIQVDFDPIAFRCEYNEYPSAWDAMCEYRHDDMPTVEDTGVDENGHGMDLVEIQEEQERLALEWLEERTTVIPFDGRVTLGDGTVLGNSGVIIQQF